MKRLQTLLAISGQAGDNAYARSTSVRLWQKITERRKYRRITRWLKYAAVVVVLVVGTWMLSMQYVSRQTARQYTEIEVPKGQCVNLTLADGSKVWLSPLSRMKIPGQFNGKQRTIELDGEGYFAVARDEQLKNRVCRNLLLRGMRVNDGFCNAALTCRGLVQGTAWGPEANSLCVNLQPSQEMRDVLENRTTVNVVGERPASAYIAAGEDVATKAEGNVTQPGSIYTVRGKKIKVEGTEPSVGLYFVSSTGTETKVTQLAVNNPSEVTFVVPSSLDDGSYTLRIVTQYSAGANLLKVPRVLESTVYIGDAPVQEGGSSSGGGSDDGNEGFFG